MTIKTIIAITIALILGAVGIYIAHQTALPLLKEGALLAGAACYLGWGMQVILSLFVIEAISKKA